ncbi:hypothetical protein WRSd5_03493 [Shigella dysenteriae WRSd5]|nr:hypothetical protein WRSd5_03493 [Shigella dysenteriae WRSd5]
MITPPPATITGRSAWINISTAFSICIRLAAGL